MYVQNYEKARSAYDLSEIKDTKGYSVPPIQSQCLSINAGYSSIYSSGLFPLELYSALKRCLVAFDVVCITQIYKFI